MEQRNLILAVVLSTIVIFGWTIVQSVLLPDPQPSTPPAQTSAPAPTAGTPGAAPGPVTGTPEAALPLVDRQTALAQSPRIAIDAPKVRGSIALKGGRIDDVELVGYRETVDPKSPNIVLLSPSGAPDAYFAEFGWVGEGTKLPDTDTVWKADGPKLTVDKPLTLTWDNGEGVRFSREFRIDPDYMFTVTQRIENTDAASLKIHPYGRIQRVGTPTTGITRILHEGPMGVFGNGGDDTKFRLYEKQYHNLPDQYHKAINPDGSLKYPNGSLGSCPPDNLFQSVGGWLGITDKFWLVALVPDSKQRLDACFRWEL